VGEDEGIDELKTMIENHLKFTGSNVERGVLDNW